MPPSLLALLGFISWTLILLLLMEAIRSKLVLTGAVAANGFNPENSNLSPFMQRLARAHANCLEGLPIFGGLLVLAVVAGKAHLTDPLAYLLLAARIVQSVVHLASLSPTAVTVRFLAFAVQVGIAVYWAVKLFMYWCSAREISELIGARILRSPRRLERCGLPKRLNLTSTTSESFACWPRRDE